MDVVFGSTNRGKIEEVSRIVGTRSKLVLIDLETTRSRFGLPDIPVAIEDGTTYEHNARCKALTYARWCQRPVIADDTGLEVGSLGGLPGVYTAGFGFERFRSLLLPGVSYPARFVCCMCFADSSGRTVSVVRAIQGAIVIDQRKEVSLEPLPYSRFFIPSGEITSLRELSTLTTYRSHRGMALEALLGVLL